MFTSIVDLVSLSMFLGVSPAVRENLGALGRGEKRDLSAYKAYLKQVVLDFFFPLSAGPVLKRAFFFAPQVAAIQCEAVLWFRDVVPKLFNPNMPLYPKQLHKV